MIQLSTTRVLFSGLIASIVMGMIEMVYEAVAGGGFWSPVVYIAGTVLRDLQTVAVPVPFLAVPVVVGLMGHMMNSVILGVVFSVLIATRLRGVGETAFAGAVYALAVFFVMWLAVLPLVDPVMLRLNPVVFAIAHIMWGAALGLILASTQPRRGVIQTVHAH
jgi:hypothetical protein